MPGSTPKYVIPYAVAADTVASWPQSQQDQAARLDLLLGESGVWTPTLTANTAATTAITLSRTYPGNASGTTPGMVQIMRMNAFGSGATQMYWVINFTGSVTTVTGFTIGTISSAAGSPTLVWRFLPIL